MTGRYSAATVSKVRPSLVRAFLLLRCLGSLCAILALVTLARGVRPLEEASRAAASGHTDGLAATASALDQAAFDVIWPVAPWISAGLLLCLLLVQVTRGPVADALASVGCLLFGALMYCPPIAPLSWLLLAAVFAVPAVFVFRSRGIRHAGWELTRCAQRVAVAMGWLLVWPVQLIAARRQR